jgi:hypothetical protein
MADINLTKAGLPFLLSGNGTLTVHASVPNLNQQLTPSDADLLSADFGAAGDQAFTFGATDTIKLGIKAQSKNHLYALWPTSSSERLQILDAYGLSDFFAKHPDQLLLVLDLDASASANVAGSFQYSVLTASATLDAGGNVGYIYLRPYVQSTTVDKMIPDFFAHLRLPAQVSSSLPMGEVIAFEYGGYLKFGAGLSVGYELKGSPSFEIGQLQLSEHYDLSVIGKLGVNAHIAGNFLVEVRSTDDAHASGTNWARVIVRKSRSSAFQIAADVSVDASSDLQGLPDSGDEFLEALLGLRAKNWLNMLARVRELSDINALQSELDDLAKQYITEFVGKAFDKLSTSEFGMLLENVQKVVDSYQNLGNEAVTLFDRYFGKLDVLVAQLNKLAALTSWDQLTGETDGELWIVLRQLTGGDPLGWILDQIQIKDSSGNPVSIPSLKQLQTLVQNTLDLIQKDAHDEIRKVIALAKSSFGLDGFINDLSKVDSIPKLKALADQKLGAFVERLLGKAVDQLKNNEIGQALDQIHKTLVAINTFEGKVYSKFKDAVHQSFSFQLHAEYNRASENNALIDVEINLDSDAGKKLMQAASCGDFQDVLSSYRPDLVRLNSGTLTHKLTSDTSFTVNILGWHGGWHYQGLDRVIVQTDQQIVAEKNGGLTIYSNVDLTDQHTRETTTSKVQTNFLLRFLGESHRVLKFDPKNQQYLIDAITGMAASYDLSFSDTKTPKSRLAYYLSIASDFGLVVEGATVDNLVPLLPTKPGVDDFGPMTAEYQVRYTDDALRRLFGAKMDESIVRQIARSVVLASYLKRAEFVNLGWCYWTQGIYNSWKEGQDAFTNHVSAVEFRGIAPSPFAQPAPASAVLEPSQLQVLSTLFFIEDDLVAGLQALDSLMNKGEISPHDFESALHRIASALQKLANFSAGVNTIFAIFDQLVGLQTSAPDARISSLTITSQVGSRQVTKVFLAMPPAESTPALHLVSPRPMPAKEVA